MPVDPAAEVMRQHLRAQADAEKRLLLPEWHREPVDLAANEIVGIVRAHRAAEIDGAGVVRHGLRQRIAEARAAQVEGMAALAQGMTDAPRARRLLVQDDQNWLRHDAVMSSKMGGISMPRGRPAARRPRNRSERGLNGVPCGSRPWRETARCAARTGRASPPLCWRSRGRSRGGPP